MRISIRMLKLDYWIVYRATFLSSHPISLFVLHVSNNLHDDPFHGHRNKKRFSSIEIRVHFMEMYPSISAIIEIRSDILRRNQDCRREREKTLISFSIRVRSTSPNSNTDGNHILRHHRYNFLNDAMESDIWLTRATTIRPDKSMKCSITNPRVRPRLRIPAFKTSHWKFASYIAIYYLHIPNQITFWLIFHSLREQNS